MQNPNRRIVKAKKPPKTGVVGSPTPRSKKDQNRPVKSDVAAQILFSFYQRKVADEILDSNSIDWEQEFFGLVNNLNSLVRDIDDNSCSTVDVKARLEELLDQSKPSVTDQRLHKVKARNSSKIARAQLEHFLPDFVGEHLALVKGTTAQDFIKEAEGIHKQLYKTTTNVPTIPSSCKENTAPRISGTASNPEKESHLKPASSLGEGIGRASLRLHTNSGTKSQGSSGFAKDDKKARTPLVSGSRPSPLSPSPSTPSNNRISRPSGRYGLFS